MCKTCQECLLSRGRYHIVWSELWISINFRIPMLFVKWPGWSACRLAWQSYRLSGRCDMVNHVTFLVVMVSAQFWPATCESDHMMNILCVHCRSATTICSPNENMNIYGKFSLHSSKSQGWFDSVFLSWCPRNWPRYLDIMWITFS